MANPKTSSNENVRGALAYFLGIITGIVFLIVEKNSRFVRFHAMQSTITFGILFVLNFIIGWVPLLGAILGSIISLASVVLWFVLMYEAYSGKMYKLPVIGDMAARHVS